MQIRNDYNPYSGTGYQQSHTHHITECLHEDKKKQQGAAAAGIRKDEDSSAGQEPAVKEIHEEGSYSKSLRSSGRLKVGMRFFQDAWEALGDEGGQAKKEGLSPEVGEIISRRGVSMVVAAIKQSFSAHIVNKWEAAKEKIKVGIHSALKRFKGEDSFAALTDTGSRQTGAKDSDRRQIADRDRSTGTKTENIQVAYRSDSHLLDSYSSTGEYCRLNENLTYHKFATVKREDKPISDSEEMLDKG